MKKFATISCLFFYVFTYSQNVGIGTLTPQEKLHVFNNGVATVLSETNAASQYAAFEAKTTAGINDKLLLRKYMPGASGSVASVNLDNLSLVLAGAQAGPLMVGVITANPLYFTTSNTERMRVTAGGDIGIGTGIPAYSLHLARESGEASVGVNATGTASQALLNLGIDNRIDGNSLLLLKFRSGVAGTSAGIPRSNLSIVAADAGAGALLISTNQASPLHFATNNIERMRLLATGHILVNNSADIGQFNVNGTGASSAGYFYSNDATGQRAGIVASINTTGAASAAVGAATYMGGGVSPLEAQTYAVVGQSGDAGISVAGYSIGSTALRGKSVSGKALYTTGQVRLEGINEADGRVLTSDATGNASWKSLPASASVWAVAGNNIYNTNTGYVGIGTNTPATFMHLRSVTDPVLIRAQTPTASLFSGLQFANDDGTTEFVRFGSTYPGNFFAGSIPLAGSTALTASGGPIFIGNSSNSPVHFATNGLERLRIEGSGNIGVNTNSPALYGKLIVDRNADMNGLLGGYFGVITGLNSSTTDGSGLYGISYAPRTGSQSFAGVSGLNLSSATDRFGVIGTSYGTSSGSVYSAGVGGYGDYGVLGYSSSSSGAGMIAQHSTGKTALEINNGFIRVTGTAGNRTAFIVTAITGPGGNTSGNNTLITYASPLPTDIVMVTHNWQGGYIGAVGVYWTGSEWRLFREDGNAMPNGEKFNIIVMRQ